MRVRFRSTMDAADLTYLSVGRRSRANVSMVFLLHLDAQPEPRDLHAALVRLTGTVPRFRQRVVGTSPWTTNWSPTGAVRIDDHLTECSAAGADVDTVLAQLPELLNTPFDMTVPPWQAIHVRNLEGGGSLLVLRLHHCMGDGLTYVAALHEAFGDPARGIVAVEHRATRVRLHDVRATVTAGVRAIGAALSRRGRGALGDEWRVWATSPPPGRVDRARRGQRIALWTAPLTTWRQAAREHGGRHNDLFLLIASHAESAYRGWPEQDAVTIMPVSTRPAAGSDAEQDGSISLATGLPTIARDDVRAGRLPGSPRRPVPRGPLRSALPATPYCPS